MFSIPYLLISPVLKVAALKEHYRNLAANERKLEQADFLGLTIIPTIAGCFIAGYWILGMMKYHSPDWSAYLHLLPELQVQYQYENKYQPGLLLASEKILKKPFLRHVVSKLSRRLYWLWAIVKLLDFRHWVLRNVDVLIYLGHS